MSVLGHFRPIWLVLPAGSCPLHPENGLAAGPGASLEVNRASATEVAPNDDFRLKVVEHAREHDAVFRVRS